jgi:hypothetical protein
MFLEPITEGIVDAGLPTTARGPKGIDDVRRKANIHRFFWCFSPWSAAFCQRPRKNVENLAF